jgi:NAD-dependent DNA ligase
MEAKLIAKISKYPEEELQLYTQTEDLAVLHKIKLYSDDLYYNTGKTSGLEDWQYDVVKEALNDRDPDYVVPIGVRIRQHENRVQLPYWLGSMDKISVQAAILYYYKDVEEQVKVELGEDVGHTAITKRVEEMWEELSENERDRYRKKAVTEFERELATWIAQNKAQEYIIEDKLDGVSCLMVMTNGKIKLYTRGDGEVGADISYLAQYFSTIPKGLSETLSVRGELIMKKTVFKKKYDRDYANPRNMVAGRIGAKTVRKGLRDIEFVAYEVVGEGIMDKPSEQLTHLDSLGFTTARREIAKSFTVESLMETLVRFKDTTPYEIDGIIVQPNAPYERNTAGNPDYAFAFKMRMGENVVEVPVVGVDWNVSKWGQLKPRVEIQPVQLQGVTITFATGFNAKFIVDNSIGPGAIIKVTRSGDVIPYIVEVVKKASEPDIPDIPYKWNETGVDIFTEEYGDEMCVKLIASFFAKLGIKQVGEQRVAKIYAAGYDSLLKIIAASKEDLTKVPSFGSRMAEIVYKNIHEGLKNLSLPLVLGSSGVFGFGLGRKKITTLMDDFPSILDEYKTMSKSELLARVLCIEGYSDKTAQKIVDNVEWADQFIQAMKNFATFKEKIVVSNNMKGMKVVFTGFRDKKLEEDAVSRGGKVTTSISSNTSVLVVKSKASKPSGKMKKALDLGVEVLTKEEFMQKYII